MIQVSLYRISDPNIKVTATEQMLARLIDTGGDRLEFGANQEGSLRKIDREHIES
jgi:hypothetical protein